ncbi:MAG: hypothetical protein WCY75_06945 [Sulfurimonadaceae bacterium]
MNYISGKTKIQSEILLIELEIKLRLKAIELIEPKKGYRIDNLMGITYQDKVIPIFGKIMHFFKSALKIECIESVENKQHRKGINCIKNLNSDNLVQIIDKLNTK